MMSGISQDSVLKNKRVCSVHHQPLLLCDGSGEYAIVNGEIMCLQGLHEVTEYI